MTETRKQLNKELRKKKDHEALDSKSTSAIVWFLIRRHNDNLTILILALVFGYIIGSKL